METPVMTIVALRSGRVTANQRRRKPEIIEADEQAAFGLSASSIDL
jgi:hypothetical protein